MRKRLFALVICAVMVSAMATTSAVSATQAGKSDIRQYDVKRTDASGNIVVYGKLTVTILEDGTGQFVVNANLNKIMTKEEIDQLLEELRQPGTNCYLVAGNFAALPGMFKIRFPDVGQDGFVTLHDGGTIHGAGTVPSYDVTWLNTMDLNGVTYGDGATWVLICI